MTMRLLPWLTLGFLSLAAAAVIGFFASVAFGTDQTEDGRGARAESPPPQDQPLVTFVDPAKGSPDADILIVEYGDHACLYCRAAEQDVDRLLAEMPGRVRFVWKDLPSPVHAGADIAAEAAHCARDQGMFWEYHAALFASGGTFNQTGLTLLANELGLDLPRFGQCLSGREKRHLVERSVNEARALGIDAVPYFFINGVRYPGQPSYAELVEAAGR